MVEEEIKVEPEMEDVMVIIPSSSFSIAPKESSSFLCPYCDKEFGYLWSQKRHITRVHGIDAKATNICPYCHKKLSSKSSVDRHILAIHKQLKNKNQFVGPKQTDESHAPDIYPCSACSKTFRNIQNRVRHHREAHGIDERFKLPKIQTPPMRMVRPDDSQTTTNCLTCSYCDKKYRYARGLQTHIKEKHASEADNLYACDFPGCKRLYFTEHMYLNHLKEHDGPEERIWIERISTCDLCKGIIFDEKMTSMIGDDGVQVFKCSRCMQM